MQNFSIETPLVVIPLHLTRQYTATLAAAAKFRLPFKGQLIGLSATARASGGTTPTLTVDLKDDGVSSLSAPLAITAGTVAEAVVANPAIGDESDMTVDLAIGGTTPTWDDITILLTVARI